MRLAETAAVPAVGGGETGAGLRAPEGIAHARPGSNSDAVAMPESAKKSRREDDMRRTIQPPKDPEKPPLHNHRTPQCWCIPRAHVILPGMSRISLMLAAALLFPACDSGETEKDDAPAKPGADEAATAKPDTPAKPDAEKKDDRVLAASGLGVGGRLSAFQILNCDDGSEYCQVCRYGSSPKIMAVGTVDDEAFHKDLKDLDAIVKKYGADKVKAFAVVTELEGGKAITPKDAKAAQEKAKALKAKLGVEFPVVVPAPEDGGKNGIWEDYYNITKSRTVMFSNGKNEVLYSGVEPQDFAALGEAIENVLGA